HPARTCLLLSCYFRSSPSGVPPPPRSFPTRRSSDLAPGRVTWLFGRAPEGLEQEVTRTGARFVRHGRDPMADLVLVQRVAQVPGDRKSTRLNSSHVEISYAVLCLKKKKKYTSYSTQG